MNNCLGLWCGIRGPLDSASGANFNGEELSSLLLGVSGETALGTLGIVILENKLWFLWITRSVDI